MMEKTSTFEIRAYGKSELAMLYFPMIESAKGALSNLNYWIRQNQSLCTALKDCGMSPKAKFFTPKEVALIAHFLGEPL